MSTLSLHNQYGMKWSACQLASILINIVLLIYSHIGPNGVIYSTINFEEPDNSFANLTDACINNIDLPVWNGTSVDGTPTSAPEVDYRCRLWDKYFGKNGIGISNKELYRDCPYSDPNLNANDSILDFLFLYGITGKLYSEKPREYLENGYGSTEWGFTSDCTTCMLDQVNCIANECAASCASRLAVTPGCPVEDPACSDCVEQTCLQHFWPCTGIQQFSESDYDYRGCPETDTEKPPVIDECYDLAVYRDLDRYEMFVIRFANAISEALKGGAVWLAIIICIASGAWPYLKNIFMAITWFVPMTSSARKITLRWLARLGRWSLVDMYAVVLIVACLRIDKDIGGRLLIVRASSDSAIYCFTIAALWALVQGDVIRKLNRSVDKFVHTEDISIDYSDDSISDKPIPTKKISQKMLLLYRAVVVISGIVAVTLLFVGGASVGVKVEIGGFIFDLPGANVYEYSIINIGDYLVDGCQLAEAREFVLVVAFYMLTYLFPIISLLFYVYTAINPLYAFRYRARGYVRVMNAFANFAAFDVFFFSMIVLIAQFEPLVDGSLGTQSEIICGSGYEDVCIQLKGSLQSGSFLFLGGVISGWICFYFSTYVQKGYWKQAQVKDPVLQKLSDEKGPAYEIHVGDEVEVHECGLGIVCFVGKTEFHKGVVWYGVELNEPKGKNDGSVFGVRYFSCPKNHGIFVQTNGIKLS